MSVPLVLAVIATLLVSNCVCWMICAFIAAGRTGRVQQFAARIAEVCNTLLFAFFAVVISIVLAGAVVISLHSLWQWALS